jgi:hypothetical protein
MPHDDPDFSFTTCPQRTLNDADADHRFDKSTSPQPRPYYSVAYCYEQAVWPSLDTCSRPALVQRPAAAFGGAPRVLDENAPYCLAKKCSTLLAAFALTSKK